MKPILVVNPNTSVEMTEAIQIGVAHIPAEFQVEVVNVDWGPTSVESELDSLLAANSVVETIWTRRDDYSGFVVACFDDPGVKEAQQLVGKPVIGIGEAAICHARDHYQKIGVLVVDTRVSDRVSSYFRSYGVDTNRTNFAGLGSCVVDLNSEEPDVVEKFLTAASALKQDGADCVVLACAGFSRQRYALEQALGLPILDGNSLAVEQLFDQSVTLAQRGSVERPQPFTGLRSSQPPWVTVKDTEALD